MINEILIRINNSDMFTVTSNINGVPTANVYLLTPEELTSMQQHIKEVLRDNLTSVIKRDIRKLRMSAGLSQTEVGEMVGCSRQAISAIETGTTHVSLAQYTKIYDAIISFKETGTYTPVPRTPQPEPPEPTPQEIEDLFN